MSRIDAIHKNPHTPTPMARDSDEKTNRIPIPDPVHSELFFQKRIEMIRRKRKTIVGSIALVMLALFFGEVIGGPTAIGLALLCTVLANACCLVMEKLETIRFEKLIRAAAIVQRKAEDEMMASLKDIDSRDS